MRLVVQPLSGELVSCSSEHVRRSRCYKVLSSSFTVDVDERALSVPLTILIAVLARTRTRMGKTKATSSTSEGGKQTKMRIQMLASWQAGESRCVPTVTLNSPV